jgi:hypothetical protein
MPKFLVERAIVKTELYTILYVASSGSVVDKNARIPKERSLVTPSQWLK